MSRRFGLACLLAVTCWLLGSAPASAGLEDPLSILGASVDQAVDQGIKNMNADKLQVVLMHELPADADGMAQLRFHENNLGPDGGVILIGTEPPAVGSCLGESYRAKGVTPELVRVMANRVYKPAVAKNQLSDGVLALVRDVKLARTLGRDPDVPPPPTPVKVGLPWWWYIPPALVAFSWATVWAGRKRLRSVRRRARLGRLMDQLEDIQYQLKRLVPAREQLQAALARMSPPEALATRAGALEREARALDDLATASGHAIKEGDWETAERQLANALARVFPLAVGLAGILAACQTHLEGGDAAGLLDRADRSLARWQRLSEAQATWAEATAGSGSSGPQQLAERLEALAKLLTRSPMDVSAVEDFLEATEAVYGRALSAVPAIKP